MENSFDNSVIKEFPHNLTTYCGSEIPHRYTGKECSPNSYLQHYQHQLKGNQSMCVTETIDNDLKVLFDMDSNIVDFLNDSITTSTDQSVYGLPPITGGLV